MTLVKLGGNNNYYASTAVSLQPEGGSDAWFDFSAAVTEEDNVIASTLQYVGSPTGGAFQPVISEKYFQPLLKIKPLGK